MKKKSLLMPALSSLVLSAALLSVNNAQAEETTITAPFDTTTELAVTSTSLEESPVDASQEFVQPEIIEVASAETTTATDPITILHTNDIHGRIEEGSGVIGTAKLANVVEETRSQGTTLVLDAGDAFQGLPISNSSKGEDMAKIMNTIGYDAMAVGNHEFDFTLAQAEKYKELLNFPLLSANVYVNDARIFQAYTVIDQDTTVDGDEFVVIGVTTPETATKTHPQNVVGVTFTDPIQEVNNVIAQIEAQAVAEGKNYKRYIILGHLGVDTTTPVEWRGSTLAQALAENEVLKDKVVIVIDGHSHTVESATYGNVTYNQTGSYLNNIGKITLNSEKVLSAGLITAEEAQALTANESVAALVADIKTKYEAENTIVVLDNMPVELDGQRSNVRVRETNLGNVIADALLDYGQTSFTNKTNLAVTNGGGIRETLKANQPVTKGDMIAVLPFGNVISQIQVTGQQIQDMFIKSLGAIAQVDANGQPVLDENGLPLLEATGGFLHVSGAKVYYDTNLPAENRILAIEILDPETQTYKALDWATTYYLATNDFLAAGGDGYSMLGGAREEGPSMDTVFADYLASGVNLTAHAIVNPNSRLVAIRLADYVATQEKLSTDTPAEAPEDKELLSLDVIGLLPTNQESLVNQSPQSAVQESAILASDAQVAGHSSQTGWTSQNYLPQAMTTSATKSESIAVSYKTSETFLPTTSSKESQATIFLGLGLIAYGLVSVRRSSKRY